MKIAPSPIIARLNSFIETTKPAMLTFAQQLNSNPNVDLLKDVGGSFGGVKRDVLSFVGGDPQLRPNTPAGNHLAAAYHNLETSRYLTRPRQLKELSVGTAQDMVRNQILSVVANLDAVRAALAVSPARGS